MNQAITGEPLTQPSGRWWYYPLALGIALVALYGGSLPNDTRSDWFRNLTRPDILPAALERLIPFIWLGLFLLGGIGLAGIWSARRSAGWKATMVGLLVVQLLLNYGYSYTFTMLRDIASAFWVAVALAGVSALIVGLAGVTRVWLTAICFLPYFLWVAFATYVTYLLNQLNG